MLLPSFFNYPSPLFIVVFSFGLQVFAGYALLLDSDSWHKTTFLLPP